MFNRAASNGSLFAATPRDPKSNPFDIIEHAMSPSQQLQGLEQVVVVGDAQLSDSDPDDAPLDYAWEAGDEYRGIDSDDDELGLNENDPSLYRFSSSTAAAPPPIRAALGTYADRQQCVTNGVAKSDPSGEDTAVMQVDDEGSAKVNRKCNATTTTITTPERTAGRQKRLDNVQGIQKKQAQPLVFSKPPESLSLRTQLSITSERPLSGLDPLKEEGTLLAHTSLCKRMLGTGIDQPSLDRLADSLLYWEASAPELNSSPTTATAATGSSGDAITTKSTAKQPTASTASVKLMHQALTSLFTLQKEAPSMYPFVYLCAREFTVVFQMVARKEMSRHSSNNRNNTEEATNTTDVADYKGAKPPRHVHVAVISQSHMGLRRTLHAKGIKFALPLAPKIKHSWGELVDFSDPDAQKEGTRDQHCLHTSSFDKTWRSAVLVMGDADVALLFDHLKSGATALHDVHVYSPAPFLNATMRCAAVRFSDVVTYSDMSGSKLHLDAEEESSGCRPQATRIYKMDVSGIVFPCAWATILKSVAEILCDSSDDSDDSKAQGFSASAKELSDTVHLNLLVSKQGSSVAGKRSVSYSPSSRKFMYK
ncbi:hypothetical protein GGI23_002851 [Coemansia sp. RSA 2559]|nr:hypothetical protein GGI23_002851 [Coemansia sp. RSA 2559]